VFQVTGAFAEFERSMIRQRNEAGLKRAVAQGARLGRPKVDEAHKQLKKGVGILKVAKMVGRESACRETLTTFLMVRNNAAILRRASIVSAEYRPCLNALVLPLGAPGDFPPCSRHRPFGIAGDWHRLPLLVRVPHRRLRCIGDLLCMGLILQCWAPPSPRGPDHARRQPGRRNARGRAPPPRN
jgi:hypothetical protein